MRAQALPARARWPLSNASAVSLDAATPPPAGCERIADIPAYGSDPLVRRAESLQSTALARAPVLRVNAATLARHGLAAGTAVRVRQGEASAVLPCALDAGLPDEVVRIAAGHPASAGLGAQFGVVTLERA